MTDRVPRRRKTDSRRQRFAEALPERFYRDVWLFLVSVLALASILIGQDQNRQRVEDIQASRVEAIRSQCESTHASLRQATKRVAALHFSPRGSRATVAILQAMDRYPKDCEAYALRTVTPPPIPRRHHHD